ncbi:2-oxoglutarate dehydrogenase E1 component [Candidatus Mycalebacterium sp.]
MAKQNRTSLMLEDLFHGPNSAVVMEIYSLYLKDRSSVSPEARALFDAWTPPENGLSEMQNGGATAARTQAADSSGATVATANLAQAIRLNGHLDSKLDPLGTSPAGDKLLSSEFHGLTEKNLAGIPPSVIDSPITKGCSNAAEVIQKLREVYSSFSGYDFQHIYYSNERLWMMGAAESGKFRPPLTPIDLKSILEQLCKVEALEKFLHKVFPGKFRFSIEGMDMLVPMINEFVSLAADSGVYHITLGMAHRGRLNVMHNVMDKPCAQSLVKFKDSVYERDFRDDMGWTGDVKYHEGAVKPLKMNGSSSGDKMLEIVLAPNPSHLESVNPVIQGMARGAGTDSSSPGEPKFDPMYSLPVIIHGDAAFPGQGINAETLNMSLIPGYSTGGTLHIITNNQIGYTTIPKDSRSTLYSSDLVKGFEVPVIHINADEPEACMEAIRIAFSYIRKFNKDFLIDLVGYRRHGHNEGDEPKFTQPLLYEKISQQPTAREKIAGRCAKEGIMDKTSSDKLFEEHMAALTKTFETLPEELGNGEMPVVIPEEGAAKKAKTAFPAAKLKEMNKALLEVPDGFSMNYKVSKARGKRRDALKDPKAHTVDWALGEELAYASILADGVPIRFSGQDCQRGTFSHRHAVLHDSDTGKEHIPLREMPQAKAAFEIINSPLTENACIGFEYGYSIQKPDTLIVWEAQYGDFINGAQPLIDEYLVSGRSKWGQISSLVLLLPHAYEGQGPDHSSGRLERFLGMAAEKNIRVVNCTTSAQFFHVLRRQAMLLKTDPLPLVVMTPKSLLRNPLASSSLEELSSGRFIPVIDDPIDKKGASKVSRVLLCSGKVAIDLEMSELRKKHPEVAIIRVEQIYHPPVEEIEKAVSRYGEAKEVIWLQEEPVNMGAWDFIHPFLRRIVRPRNIPLGFIARKRNSSPAEGSMSMHKANQAILLEQAFSAKEIYKIEKSGVMMGKNV